VSPCQPTCYLPGANLGDLAICSKCGALWEARMVTEMTCETIGGEPIPGAWQRCKPILSWYRQLDRMEDEPK
jgi:hypothetical protein